MVDYLIELFVHRKYCRQFALGKEDNFEEWHELAIRVVRRFLKVV